MSHNFFHDGESIPEIGSTVKGYKLEKILDNTANSVVYVAIDNESGQKVALKMIKCRENNVKRVESELHLLQSLRSPYIIATKDCFDYPPFKCVVMPLAISDMHVFLDHMKTRCISEEVVKKFMRYALNGLKYLHSNNICHRDIKPDNFLIVNEGNCEVVQLGDLGFAKEMGANELCNEYLGTLNYAAPEVICGTPYDRSVDIWSLGVSMYTLLSGQPPFPINPESTLRRCIKSGAFFFPASRWGNISKEAKDLIRHMIKVNPKERFSAEQCLNHSWFKSTTLPKSNSCIGLSSVAKLI